MQDESSKPLIEVRDLVRFYGDFRAVGGVSFEVKGGQIYGLLGPNGAGKTTTLRMLATLLEPDEGSALICGFNTVEHVEEVRRRIGYQTGDTRLYERLKPAEFLRYFGDLHDMERGLLERRITELIEALDIGEFKERRCGSLSTGQQQRVSIARALLHDPPVLILDEPTSGLDILSAQFILDFLKREKARGKAIIYSTHIMSEVEILCDQIGLLFEGELMSAGSLEEILTKTGESSLTRAFLASIEAHKAAKEASRGSG